jgi:Fur family ferric uptake transcriptional regulator
MIAFQTVIHLHEIVTHGEGKKKQKADIHKELANFSNYLKKKGLKITNQRLLVAEKIFNLETHFTVDSLFDMLKDRRGEISRATIYRIVSLLVESGQITEYHFGQNVKYYEHVPARKHHDHIVCVDCGLIEEFIDQNIEKIQLEIAARFGFDLADHSMTLYGSCQQLKKTGKCDRKKKAEILPKI